MQRHHGLKQNGKCIQDSSFVFEYKDTDFMASPLSMVWST